MIVPTPLAIAIAAAGAPIALALALVAPGLWPLGLGWVVVVGLLIAGDAVVGADRRRLNLTVDQLSEAYIGSPVSLRTSLGFASGPPAPGYVRIELETNALLEPQLSGSRVQVAHGAARTDMLINTVRRGAGILERIHVRWTCPLGLVEKGRVFQVDKRINVLPDIRAVKAAAVRMSNRDLLVGAQKDFGKGSGSEFESLREFVAGMDPRTIDWKQSARHMHLLGKEYQAERDQTIILAVDTGRLMCEPVGGAPRIDHAVNAALILGYLGLKAGDRVGIFGFDERPRTFSGVLTGLSSFKRLQASAAQLEYSDAETNFALGLSRLAAEVRRRSLIVIFTDFVDATSAELMLESVGRLMRRHLVLFVTLRDQDLEELVLAEPARPDDISRSVIAYSLQQEKEVVLTRLARAGAEILHAPADQLGGKLIARYLDLKQRSRI